jgi:hypothetical protein
MNFLENLTNISTIFLSIFKTTINFPINFPSNLSSIPPSAIFPRRLESQTILHRIHPSIKTPPKAPRPQKSSCKSKSSNSSPIKSHQKFFSVNSSNFLFLFNATRQVFKFFLYKSNEFLCVFVFSSINFSKSAECLRRPPCDGRQ